MAVLQIVTAPDPRLKQVSQPVDKVDDALRTFIDDMCETMYAAKGIGLAAVQVGVHKRILVMDIEQPANSCCSDVSCDENDFKPLVLINPELFDESKEQNVYEEGCLSFPNQYADVERPKTVKVKYLDYDGAEQIMECDELLATCVQHEIDHLNGIVFVDHISKLKRNRILNSLAKKK